ncbi:Glycosyltransferase family 92 protein [Gracilariopsis chorda]|uniref:Glycosyltransferase family 92 protein n=1 Tax=Gracilariopsis chorda TaxID=448386 RepID=A0A2V3IN53_9FLOR|nr:Glycosyltransferase family 92 protein [Gracilariopsis chorda]|eukprot:PXF43502.1 Glycosyltransferase family 92 protein [Gracilariopsis chorda]
MPSERPYFPAKQPRRRSLSSRVLLVVVLVPVIFIPLLNRLPGPLPPKLAPLLSHTQHVYPAAPNDWKRPLTISLHAENNASNVRLTLFTTGVHTDTYGRSFKSVGCLVGDKPFPAIETRPEMTVCTVHPSELTYDTPLTVLLEVDDTLRTALNSTQLIKGENFTVFPEDVTVLPQRTQSARDAMPDNMAAVRTAVRWRSHMLDVSTGSRYELCMMTAMRQYPFLLRDWMQYYRRMGVDYFYIYENNADVPLKQHVDGRFVQVVHWPWSRSQMQSNNHFLLVAPKRCRYVAFFDADEYVMIGDDKPHALKRYIFHRRAQGFTEIVFHFLMMVNSGYVRRPKGSLPELYTHREKGQVVRQGKVALDMNKQFTWHRIHMVDGVGIKMYWNTSMELEPKSMQHNSMLVHYTKRSWEDFVAKNAVGGASVMTTGRPKKVLDVDKPDPKYMATAGEPFDGFRTRWRRIISGQDDGRIRMERVDEDGRVCDQDFCPACLLRRMGPLRCGRT